MEEEFDLTFENECVEHSSEPGQPSSTYTKPSSGVVVHEEWRKLGDDGELHRLDGPAIIDRCYRTGRDTRHEWYSNGKLHREDGPALVEFDAEGCVAMETWYRNGQKHRVGAPAHISIANGVVFLESWYQDDFLHRLDGPAEILRNPANGIVASESWHVYSQFYRAGNLATTTKWDKDTGALYLQTFNGVEEMPTRAEALRRRLNALSYVTFIDLAP